MQRMDVLLLTILSSFISSGNGVRCYICSFSPYDRNNRTDKCTEHNFQHQKVYSDECRLGCESVVQYDANDEMEQWKRNCLQEGHKLTNACENERTPALRLVRCTCDKDLCNSSPMRPPLLYLIAAIAFMTFKNYKPEL